MRSPIEKALRRDEYRPFYYFYGYRTLFGQLVLAAGGLAIAAVVSRFVSFSEPAYLGLIAVASMPFLTYAVIGYHAFRGTLQPQLWRTARQKKLHQWQELYHYISRVIIAFSAGQFIAHQLSSQAEVAGWLLPILLYIAQSRPYHDMHVVMHVRGQRLSPAEATFESRERADSSGVLVAAGNKTEGHTPNASTRGERP